MPAVRNDPQLVSWAAEMLDGYARIETIRTPPMTSDDFALLSERWPGLYLKLGIAGPDADDWPPLHSSEFDIDEDCLGTGVLVVERLARTILERNR